MLKTRLWMGTILVVLAAGALVVDQWLAPWFPFLFALVLGLALASAWELLHLFPEVRRPAPLLVLPAVACLVGVNWLVHLLPGALPWPWIAGVLTATVLAAFLWEMAVFRDAGEVVNRMALAVWSIAYVGLLPSFLVQLRWQTEELVGAVALALAIFVPKCCDTGAYFTGRLLGRHPFAPVLSPRKTWEGVLGGLAAAALAAVAINRLGPALTGGLLVELLFGLSLGVAGILGDLAESLIKRDCQHKDASQLMPGFGGVLDVVDSIVFAAPVAYLWLAFFARQGPRTG